MCTSAYVSMWETIFKLKKEILECNFLSVEGIDDHFISFIRMGLFT
jgi:hypothetical protein